MFDPLKITDDKIDMTNLQWMWHFFAEPPSELRKERHTSFGSKYLIKRANEILLSAIGNPHTFFSSGFPAAYRDAYKILEETFTLWCPIKFTLILLCDEARSLCEQSAYDGKPLPNENAYNEFGHASPTSGIYTTYPYSNFRGLRRALRLLILNQANSSEPFPRLFGLFTDTASLLADFQPYSEYEASLRLVREPTPGNQQFDPLYMFTSIDVHARSLGRCLSNIHDVANPERLIKFGRPGRHSLYTGKNRDNIIVYDLPTLTIHAGSKLVSHTSSDPFDLNLLVTDVKEHRRFPSKRHLQLLALLAVRLDIAAGPFTTEAGELVSSHVSSEHDVPDYLPTQLLADYLHI